MKGPPTKPPLAWSIVETHWGYVAVAGDSVALQHIGYPQPSEDEAILRLHVEFGALGRRATLWPDQVDGLIRAYFAGRPVDLSTLPASLTGTTFQKQVWEAARAVGPGATLTYGDLARSCGHPRSARAVGGALAVNRAGLLVPCHRIVAVGGVGGYGNHSERKLALLAHERAAGVRSMINRKAEPPIGAG